MLFFVLLPRNDLLIEPEGQIWITEGTLTTHFNAKCEHTHTHTKNWTNFSRCMPVPGLNKVSVCTAVLLIVMSSFTFILHNENAAYFSGECIYVHARDSFLWCVFTKLLCRLLAWHEYCSGDQCMWGSFGSSWYTMRKYLKIEKETVFFLFSADLSSCKQSFGQNPFSGSFTLCKK